MCGDYLQYNKDQGKGKKGWSDAQRFGGETSLLRCGGEVQSTSVLLSLAAAKAGVKEDQGKLEDLERFGVSDHYGEIDEDHDILGGCMTEFEFK